MVLSIHCEDYYHALVPDKDFRHYEPRIEDLTYQVLGLCLTHHIHGVFYVLGDVALKYPDLLKDILDDGHVLGSHGFAHRHGEHAFDDSDQATRYALTQQFPELTDRSIPYCSPFWSSTKRPGFAGGAYFRFLPYPILKREALRTGEVYLHPHDWDAEQPRLPDAPWYRYWGADSTLPKLERLFQDVRFDDPRKQYGYR